MSEAGKKLEASMQIEHAAELSVDIADQILDGITTLDPLLENIPIFKYIHGINKTAVNIREYVFTRKIVRFLNEFNKTEPDTRKRFIEDQIAHDEQGGRFGAVIIEILDKAESATKARIIGRILRSAATSNRNLADARKLCFLVNSISESDLIRLINSSETRFSSAQDQEFFDSLLSAGFLSLEDRGMIWSSTIDNTGMFGTLNKYGQWLTEINRTNA